MNLPAFVFYRGRKYWLTKRGKYYRAAKRYDNIPEQFLHRVIWYRAHGEIKKGWCVHHKNHDSTDNRLSNLQLVTRSEHAKYHRKLYLRSLSAKEKEQSIRKLVDGGNKWRRTALAKRFMRLNGYRSVALRSNTKRSCVVCGRIFSAYRAIVCSKFCGHRHQRNTHLKSKTCAICGAAFKSYRKDAATCSHRCKGVKAQRTQHLRLRSKRQKQSSFTR